MYFHYFVIISPWKRVGPSFEQSWIPFTQGCFVPSLVEIGSVILEKKLFLILSMYFRYFVIISPWERVGPFIWTNLIPFNQWCIVPSLVEIDPVDLLISSMYFRYFVMISPWKMVGPFIWTNLNPLHPRMLCAKFGWNWSGQRTNFDQKSLLEPSAQVS